MKLALGRINGKQQQKTSDFVVEDERSQTPIKTVPQRVNQHWYKPECLNGKALADGNVERCCTPTELAPKWRDINVSELG